MFQQRMGCLDAAAAASTSPADATTALQAAQLCYLFVPLQQQQQQQQQRQQIDWDAVKMINVGLSSIGDALSDGSSSSSSSSSPVATLPASTTAQQVTTSRSLLADRILLAGHSSTVYRCIAISEGMSPATALLEPFSWRTAAAGATDSDSCCTADTHAEYYERRYSISQLRTDLPMLMVQSSGRSKDLAKSPFKPWKLQQQQKIAKRLQEPDRITDASAAAAAVRFDFQLPQHADADSPAKRKKMEQQQQQEATAEARDSKRSCQQQQQDKQQQQQAQAPAGPSSSSHDKAAAADYKVAASSSRVAGGEVYQPVRDVYLPLELCWLLPLTEESWRQLNLLPAFMYRINSLLKVHRIRQHLQQAAALVIEPEGASSQGASSGGFLVPASELLMVALTGTSAAEAFDQEGLEFLGDVVLKFLAASCVLQVGSVLPPWDTSTHHVGHGRFSGNLVH
jgi:hypothetical protein